MRKKREATLRMRSQGFTPWLASHEGLPTRDTCDKNIFFHIGREKI